MKIALLILRLIVAVFAIIGLIIEKPIMSFVIIILIAIWMTLKDIQNGNN